MTESLMKCTLRKSWHTTERLIVWCAYAVVSLAALAVAGWATLAVAGWAIMTLTSHAPNPIIWLAGILMMIPWYGYVIIAVPVAIVTHSLIWCIQRDVPSTLDYGDKYSFYMGALFLVSVIVFGMYTGILVKGNSSNGGVTLVLIGSIVFVALGILIHPFDWAYAVYNYYEKHPPKEGEPECQKKE